MSVNRASEVWKEIKPFALRDLFGLKDTKNADSMLNSSYSIILYDESAKKIKLYSASSSGLRAALAAASVGDIVFLPACTIANDATSYTPGSEISNGAVSVTSEAGTQISGLTPGQWYSVEAFNGPWFIVHNEPSLCDYYFSLSEGNSFSGAIGYRTYTGPEVNFAGSVPGFNLIKPDFCAYAEAVDTHYGRVYFKASSNSIYMRVCDIPNHFYDNDGSLSWKLRNAIVNITNVIPVGVEVAGMGENCIIDGNIENNGILTNLKVTGTISGTGTSRMVSNSETQLFSRQIKSSVPTGTSPFDVASTTVNTNLNADLLDGYHATNLPEVAHASYHASGGGDVIKLDDLAAPDDNTDLDASTSKHGLLKKLPNDDTKFLDGKGNFSTPTGIAIDEVELIDGSAAVPAIRFALDPNSGIYRISEDFIAIVVNGQVTIAIDGSSGLGRYMIGNGHPVSRFQINDDLNVAASGITLGGDPDTYAQIYKIASKMLYSNSSIKLAGSLYVNGDLTHPIAFPTSGVDGHLVVFDGTSGKAFKDGGAVPVGGDGSGDVVGPAGATDGHLAVFDGATGKLLKDGGAVPAGGSGSLPPGVLVFLNSNFS